MAHATHIILASQLSSFVEDPARGTISLVGDHGGVSLITGGISDSSMIFGALPVETEHGTIYLDGEQQITIREDGGPVEPSGYGADHEWILTWTINGEGATPVAAAAAIWREVFGRAGATDSDACVFVVEDLETGSTYDVDLSEHELLG